MAKSLVVEGPFQKESAEGAVVEVLVLDGLTKELHDG